MGRLRRDQDAYDRAGERAWFVRLSKLRRSNLKATACCIVGCLTAWFVVSAIPCRAAHPPVTGALAAAESALAQANPAAPSRDRQEVDRLLQETRQAMSRGDLEAAERLLSKAERLPVQYDPLYERFQDTPAKARRTLRDLQAARSRDDRNRPSDRFAPTLNGRGLPNATPQPAGTVPPGNGAQALDTLTDDAKAKAKTFAEKGRLALQQGDLAGATAWCQKAIGLNASFARANTRRPRWRTSCSARRRAGEARRRQSRTARAGDAET